VLGGCASFPHRRSIDHRSGHAHRATGEVAAKGPVLRGARPVERTTAASPGPLRTGRPALSMATGGRRRSCHPLTSGERCHEIDRAGQVHWGKIRVKHRLAHHLPTMQAVIPTATEQAARSAYPRRHLETGCLPILSRSRRRRRQRGGSADRAWLARSPAFLADRIGLAPRHVQGTTTTSAVMSSCPSPQKTSQCAGKAPTLVGTTRTRVTFSGVTSTRMPRSGTAKPCL